MTLLTEQEFDQLPEQEDVDHYELSDGELVIVSSATLGHNYLRDRLLIRLGNFLSANPLGT